MKYEDVTAERAKASPHYGFDGWLVVFYVLAGFSAFSAIMNMFAVAALSGFHSWGAMPWLAAAKALLWLPFLILAPLKHRLMPLATIVSLWVSAAISAVLFPELWKAIFKGMSTQMIAMLPAGEDTEHAREALQQMHEPFLAMVGLMTGVGLAFTVAYTALFTWFLLASKRVNATYRHRLPVGEA